MSEPRANGSIYAGSQVALSKPDPQQFFNDVRWKHVAKYLRFFAYSEFVGPETG